MARLVRMEGKGPVQVNGHVCMCGLSKNKPLCDGSHRQCHTEEEGKLYIYDDEKRVEVKA